MPVSRFLEGVRLHPRLAWTALLAYAAAVTFPHEIVQRQVNRLGDSITLPHLYRLSAAIALVEAAALTGVVLWRLRRHAARATMAVFWVITLALIGFTWRAFTANNTELVHYPQYIPEGAVLMALTLSPAESLSWVAIFGALDETFQYAVLSRARAVPLDFNDIYMDLLGGAVGVLLAMAFLHTGWKGPPLWKRPGIRAILAIVVAGVGLWASGYMLLFDDPADTRHWFALSRFRAPAFWFQVETNGPNRYHTLSSVEGPILILATIFLYSWMDRRMRARGQS